MRIQYAMPSAAWHPEQRKPDSQYRPQPTTCEPGHTRSRWQVNAIETSTAGINMKWKSCIHAEAPARELRFPRKKLHTIRTRLHSHWHNRMCGSTVPASSSLLISNHKCPSATAPPSSSSSRQRELLLWSPAGSRSERGSRRTRPGSSSSKQPPPCPPAGDSSLHRLLALGCFLIYHVLARIVSL
jgi:hypothetical protein